MEIIRHIKVDLYGDTQHFAVAAKQMDMGTRYIGVTLMEDGVVYEIPDNVEVIINMTKPDKTHVHNDGEKSGNEALIPLTRGMLQVHGTALCEVQLYQNGALLTSATFEMEIFPSQRDESEIIHSGEYTRLENTIAAAREALQIAQDTQNTIDAAEAVRQAQERLREAAEKAREIKESRREDDTAKAIAKCVETMEAAIEQTKKCLTATEEANKIIISQSGLDAILAAVKDYYERIRELETDININVDGGTPKSTDLLRSLFDHVVIVRFCIFVHSGLDFSDLLDVKCDREAHELGRTVTDSDDSVTACRGFETQFSVIENPLALRPLCGRSLFQSDCCCCHSFSPLSQIVCDVPAMYLS